MQIKPSSPRDTQDTAGAKVTSLPRAGMLLAPGRGWVSSISTRGSAQGAVNCSREPLGGQASSGATPALEFVHQG